MENYSTITGKVDSSKFFHALGELFDSATTVFIDGTSIEKNVLDCYLKHLEEGEYLPEVGSIFPKPKTMRCTFSKDLMLELADLSNNHAEPELLDSIHIYKEDEPILVWHDAFSNEMKISKTISKDLVEKFWQAIKK